MSRVYEDDYKFLSNEDYLKFNLNDEHSLSLESASSMKKNAKNSPKNLKKDLLGVEPRSKKRKERGCEMTESVEGKGNREATESVISDKKVGKWTKEEDEILKELVLTYGGKNWKKISENIKGRTPIQCLHRWTKILQPGLVKGPWSIQEDKKLVEWVKREGPTRWSQCAEYIKGRNGKQCRERWFNSLNPAVKKGSWTAEEDFKNFFYYKKFGGKWAKTSIYFEGRTENSLKNRFYSTLRRVAAEKKKEMQDENEIYNSESFSEENQCWKNDDVTISSCGLGELKRYLPLAEKIVKHKFMQEKNFNYEDVIYYETKLNENTQKGIKSLKSLDIEKPVGSNLMERGSGLGLGDKSSFNLSNGTINLNVNFNSSNNNTNLILNNGNGMNLPYFENPFNPPGLTPHLGCEKGNSHNNNSNFNLYKNMDIYSLEKDIVDMCDSSLFFPETQKFNFDSHLDNLLDNIFSSNNIVITNDPLQDCNVCQDKFTEFGNEKSGDISNLKPSINLNNNEKQSSSNQQKESTDANFKHPTIPKKTTTLNCETLNPQQSSQVNSAKEIWKLKCENGKSKNEVFQNLLSQLNGLEKLVKSAKKELSKFEKGEITEDALNSSGIPQSLDSLFKF